MPVGGNCPIATGVEVASGDASPCVAAGADSGVAVVADEVATLASVTSGNAAGVLSTTLISVADGIAAVRLAVAVIAGLASAG